MNSRCVTKAGSTEVDQRALPGQDARTKQKRIHNVVHIDERSSAGSRFLQQSSGRTWQNRRPGNWVQLRRRRSRRDESRTAASSPSRSITMSLGFEFGLRIGSAQFGVRFERPRLGDFANRHTACSNTLPS